MVYLTVVLRTLIMYIFLIAVMRLGGKRQIGELQLSELVTALLISELATTPLIDPEVALLRAMLPILTVIALEIAITFSTTKSQLLKKIFDGTPSVIIKKGQLDQKEMGRLRMSVEELIGECRQAGIFDISDIEYAVLEENGKLSVLESAKDGEPERGIAHVLIVDGEVSDNGLKSSGITACTLKMRLEKRGLDAAEVFLYTVNDAGEENLIIKQKK